MIRRLFAIMLFFTGLHLASPAFAGDDWSFRDTEGKTVRLSNYRGKWVLVNFWATWCPSCLAEIPDLERLYRSGKLAVIGIAVSYKTRGEVLDFVKSRGITYPIVLGNEDVAADFGGFEGLPSSFLYSPRGKLLGQHQGGLSGSDIGVIIKGSL